MELFLNDKLGKINLEIDESTNPKAILIIAHGAGAGMHHSFMHNLASRIAESNVTSVRFNFPYMEQGRKSPGSPKANIETWQLVANHISQKYPSLPLFISGKSYGGRMASHLIADGECPAVKGLIYFGFPLHAPGKDSKDRADHLVNVSVPQLFLQGTKDKLANLDLITEVVENHPTAEINVIDDADHSFNVPKRSGKSKDDILDYLAGSSTAWIDQQINN